MSIPSWNPPRELSRREQTLLKRRTKKLFGFLREYRHELFDEGFQKELASMYRERGEGKVPVAPALLAMVTLLQAYTGASDAEAVDLSMDSGQLYDDRDQRGGHDQDRHRQRQRLRARQRHSGRAPYHLEPGYPRRHPEQDDPLRHPQRQHLRKRHH